MRALATAASYHAPAHGRTAYERHCPETTLLYRTLQEHWLEFVGEIEDGGAELPAFVRDEFVAYLRCGILAHGFLRVRCTDCGHSRVVAFSCKRRGFCPSCLGSRMVAFLYRQLIEVPMFSLALSCSPIIAFGASAITHPLFWPPPTRMGLCTIAAVLRLT